MERSSGLRIGPDATFLLEKRSNADPEVAPKLSYGSWCHDISETCGHVVHDFSLSFMLMELVFILMSDLVISYSQSTYTEDAL